MSDQNLTQHIPSIERLRVEHRAGRPVEGMYLKHSAGHLVQFDLTPNRAMRGGFFNVFFSKATTHAVKETQPKAVFIRNPLYHEGFTLPDGIAETLYKQRRHRDPTHCIHVFAGRSPADPGVSVSVFLTRMDMVSSTPQRMENQWAGWLYAVWHTQDARPPAVGVLSAWWGILYLRVPDRPPMLVAFLPGQVWIPSGQRTDRNNATIIQRNAAFLQQAVGEPLGFSETMQTLILDAFYAAFLGYIEEDRVRVPEDQMSRCWQEWRYVARDNLGQGFDRATSLAAGGGLQ